MWDFINITKTEKTDANNIEIPILGLWIVLAKIMVRANIVVLKECFLTQRGVLPQILRWNDILKEKINGIST